MATKGKTVRKQLKKKKSGSKRVTPAKKRVKQGLAKKKTAQKRAAVKTRVKSNQTIASKKPAAHEKQVRRKSRSVDTVAFSPEGPVSRSSGQSGDLQGLSNVEGADSESVKELLEEGNAFEADAVMGVERAGDTEGAEVHTHERPEDDVPGEYLDKE